MLFSIIIPTFKEEKKLPILLESIKKQTFKDYEIIVADHKSPDQTRPIAKRYGASVIEGNMPGPARNNGAKHAQGNYLVFLDADVKLYPDFLDKITHKIKEQKISGGTTFVRPLSKHPFDWSFFFFANIGSWILQYFLPVAHGFIIIVHKKSFQKIKGFDESLEIGEDFDLAKRLGKLKPFKVWSSIKIQVSVRRFDKEGRLKLFWLLLKSSFKILVLKQKIKKAHYKFGDY